MEVIQNVIDIIGSNKAWIMELLMLTVGGILLARGLKIYKVMQAAVCAFLGGSIGLLLQSYFGHQELYIVALLLAALGLFLGIRYYKFGLYILASVSGWIAMFSYFWKQAMKVFEEGTQGLVDTKEFISLWLSHSWKSGDLLAALSELVEGEMDELSLVMEEVLHMIQKGILWAAVAGTLLGILALVVGDFIIILVTSILGGSILLSLLEVFVSLAPNMHLLLLVVLTGTGIVLQSMMKKT